MNLLMDKTLEYFKVTDFRGEIAIKEISTLYEMLLDSTVEFAEEERKQSGQQVNIVQSISPKTNVIPAQVQLQRKDAEIQKLQE